MYNCVFQPTTARTRTFSFSPSTKCKLTPKTTWEPRIEFRGRAEIGVLVHASLNRPTLCFNIVWIPPDVKATFFPGATAVARDRAMSRWEKANTEAHAGPFFSLGAAVSSYQYWRDLEPGLITINPSKWLLSLACLYTAAVAPPFYPHILSPSQSYQHLSPSL